VVPVVSVSLWSNKTSRNLVRKSCGTPQHATTLRLYWLPIRDVQTVDRSRIQGKKSLFWGLPKTVWSRFWHLEYFHCKGFCRVCVLYVMMLPKLCSCNGTNVLVINNSTPFRSLAVVMDIRVIFQHLRFILRLIATNHGRSIPSQVLSLSWKRTLTIADYDLSRDDLEDSDLEPISFGWIEEEYQETDVEDACDFLTFQTPAAPLTVITVAPRAD